MSMSNSYILHHLHRWMDGQRNRDFNILDVGCGHGRWGYFIKLEFPDVNLCEPGDHLSSVSFKTHVTGIDVMDNLLHYAKSLGSAYDSLQQVDLEGGSFDFKDREFNIGVCIGVLAHLSKEAGRNTIMEMLRTCDRVIVSAPSFHFTHEEGALLNDNNEHALQHRSTWSAKEFTQLGLQVRGFSLKGRHSASYIDTLLHWWTFRLPSLAGGVIGWK